MKRKSLFIVFIVCCVLASIFFIIGKNNNVVGGFFQVAFSPLSHIIFSSSKHIVSNSNAFIQQETVATFLQKVTNEKKLQDENIALRDQFQTQSPSSKTLLPAVIIGAPGFIPNVSFPEYLVLDKGSNDNVHMGSVVVYKNIALGKIAQVSPTSSQVSLISNKSSSFPIKTVTTNALGVARGQANSDMTIDNVLLSDTLKKDDMVVTYGDVDMHGNGYPPDLLVGKIATVEKNPSALFQKASLQNIIDITKLTTVFVMVK